MVTTCLYVTGFIVAAVVSLYVDSFVVLKEFPKILGRGLACLLDTLELMSVHSATVVCMLV